MAQVVPSAWERLYVFPPYSDTARVRQSLGFVWPGAERSGIAMNDGIDLLVFVAGDRVVRGMDLTRDKGDFAGAFREEGYARDSARFRVVRDGDLVGGAPHYRLVPAAYGGRPNDR